MDQGFWCQEYRRKGRCSHVPRISCQIRTIPRRIISLTHKKSQKLPVKLTALINDTTGTLIASSYVNPKTKIACIFGTGCNAAYMEHVKDIPKIKDLGIDPAVDMAINCEWVGGNILMLGTALILCYRVLSTRLSTNIFQGQNMTSSWMKLPTNQGSKHLRSRCPFRITCSNSEPIEQKLISGRYLGEILRLVICELIDEGVLFLGQNTYKLEAPYVFDTAFLSLMER
jgi:hexokinase